MRLREYVRTLEQRIRGSELNASKSSQHESGAGINGDGSVYKRQDGYWVGAFYARTTSGARKRVVVYGKTLTRPATSSLRPSSKHAPASLCPTKLELGLYLEYWLENFVKRNRRPATYALYEMIVRIYLIPGLGGQKLTSLSVPIVQRFLNQRLEKGDSVRKVQVMRTVLSSALTRAVREELITRNVARLVELPQWQRAPSGPGPPARPRLSWPPPRPTRYIRRSSCSSSTVCDGRGPRPALG